MLLSSSLLVAPSGWAQSDNSAAAVPQSTTATYDHWTLRCDNAVGTSPRKVCEIAQVIAGPDGKTALAQVVLGKPSRDAPLKLIIQLPIGVWLPSHALLVLDDKTTVTATFKRCVQLCFADANLDDTTLAALETKTEPARLLFANAEQRIVELLVSVSGLSAALDANLKAIQAR